jgi:hypothetical protein
VNGSDGAPRDADRVPGTRKRWWVAALATMARGRILSIVATAIVLTAVLLPGRDIPDVGVPGMDKAVHLLMFACWSLALRFDFALLSRRPVLLLAIGFFAAFCTETMQLAVEGRSFDPADAAFDIIGVGIVAFAGGQAVALMDRIFRPESSASSRRNGR